PRNHTGQIAGQNEEEDSPEKRHELLRIFFPHCRDDDVIAYGLNESFEEVPSFTFWILSRRNLLREPAERQNHQYGDGYFNHHIATDAEAGFDLVSVSKFCEWLRD